MSVMIGHASISEKGTINGAKGDSTKREVCTRTWYSKPWDFMAIHPDSTVREKHAKAIEDACANDNIGYGQNDRNTANTEAKKVNYVISKIKTKCNTDCSALQNLAAVASGAKGVTYGSNGWTTSTMKAALKAVGYKIIEDKTYLTSADYCVRGAIYVKASSHTVCGLTNGSKASQTLKKAGISGSATSTSSTSSSASSTSSTYTKKQFIKDVQAATGAKVDGVAGPETLSKTVTVSAKKNNKHAVVKLIQKYLYALGYTSVGTADGEAGPKFTTAVNEYQKKVLKYSKVDGEITADGKMWKSLLGLI